MKILLYLLGINLATYALYWLDKRAAVNGRWRIPESTLLLSGLAGGTVAAYYAQRRLRHKISKTIFQYKFWTITAAQVGILVVKPSIFTHAIGRMFG